MTKVRKRKVNQNLKPVSGEWMFRNLPYIGFLGLLGLCYIANTHFAEKRMRAIKIMQTDIKEIQYRYKSMNSDLMFDLRQTELAKKVANKGLIINSDQPKKIIKPKRN